jgi:hypothetical protein
MNHRRHPLRRPPRFRKLHRLALPETVSPATAPTPGLQTLTLIYHEDCQDAIITIIRRQMLVARYTKIRDVVGARTDLLEDSDFEPQGRNHLLFIVAEIDTIHALTLEFQALRQARGHGLRGYVTPVHDII